MNPYVLVISTEQSADAYVIYTGNVTLRDVTIVFIVLNYIVYVSISPSIPTLYTIEVIVILFT